MLELHSSASVSFTMSPPLIPVCLACGDKGEIENLVCCMECHDSIVHGYCMDKLPAKGHKINWLCWDCTPINIEAEAQRKSERICSKRQKVLDTRNYWKEKLNLISKKPIQINRGISGIAQLTCNGHLPVLDMKPLLLNGSEREQNLVKDNKATFGVSSHSEEQNGFTIDSHTLARKASSLEKSINLESYDVIQKVQVVIKEKRRLVLNDYSSSQEEDKLQLSLLVPTEHCLKSDSFENPSLENGDCFSAEPVIAPIWSGLFKIINEEDETCCQILAHQSNKASSKVSNAATSLPHMLEIQVLDKSVVWPKRFQVSPPTAASIALYFFPNSGRDERVYDSLVDNIIERDLALKVVIDDVELLIFSPRELPLKNWRCCDKYFLWGVFRQEWHSRSPTIEIATPIQWSSKTESLGPSEHNTDHVVLNNKDTMVLSKYAVDQMMNYQSQPSQSPLCMNSNQASNVLLAKLNTPESLSSPFLRLDKIAEHGNWPVEMMLQRNEGYFDGPYQVCA